MSDTNYNSYSVGYKKPPKTNQYKKGQSGNPKGRPPKQSFHEVFFDLMNEEVTATTNNGEKITLPIKVIILKKLLNDSMSGKHSATKNFLDLMKCLTSIPPI